MKALAFGLAIMLSAAPGFTEPRKEDVVLYRHPGRYSAFPGLVKSAADELWVSFGWNSNRSHYGPASGGKRGYVALYSPDGGKLWHQAGTNPGYKPRPEEYGTMVLKGGALLSIWPRMHEVLPMERKKELEDRGIAVKVWPAGHISASYRVLMRRRSPGARQWTSSYPKIPNVAVIAGFGQGDVLPDGTILKPVYGLADKDDPATRAWTLRSTDSGTSWQLVVMAYDGVHPFSEPELIGLPDGRVIALIRTQGGKGRAPYHDQAFLWQTESSDRGKTWSEPKRTPMWGYPPHLLVTQKGEVLCTYGYRRRPYGIRACFSRDLGKTWDIENEVILRSDAFPNGGGRGKGNPLSDLGYPKTVQLRDGAFFTVYYFTLDDGVTHIAATRWSGDFVGPEDILRGAAAIPQPDPSLPPEHIIGETGPIELKYGIMQTFIPTGPLIYQAAVRISEKSARKDLAHTYGLYVAIRKPDKNSWWTKFLGTSEVLKPQEVKTGQWNLFKFKTPVRVVPGETYALTVYNRDTIGGGPIKLKPGLTGNHAWFLNSGPGEAGDYANGGRAPNVENDIAFRIYHRPGPLPRK